MMRAARWFMIVPAMLHLFWAFALILVGPLMITPKAGLLLIFANDERWLLSVLITVSICGMSGVYLYSHNKWIALSFLLPQQAVLLLSACVCIVSMVSGVYADGEIRSQWFIVADQLFFVLFACSHTAVMIELALTNDGAYSTS